MIEVQANSDRRGIVKKHMKRSSGGAWSRVSSFWAIPVRFPSLDKGSPSKIGKQGCGRAYWERSPYNLG